MTLRTVVRRHIRPRNAASGVLMFRKSGFAPLVLIVIGVVFLLSNLGMLPPLGPLFARWWPLILIAVGISLALRRR